MIYIVRHGQTDWNVLGKWQGQANIPLNEEGIRQAKQVKDKLNNIKFDVVFSSPLQRALKTAQIITNQKIIIDERLTERNNGKLEGLTKEDINKIITNPNYRDDLYGVESTKDMQKRARSFLEEILTQYPHKNILIITHGGLIINLRCFLQGVPKDIKSYKLGNCEYYVFKN